MSAPKIGDRVKAYPVNLGMPDRTNFDPRVEGIVVGMSNAGELSTIVVEHGGALTSCEAMTASVLLPAPDVRPGTRPDLVAVVYRNGRTEARRRENREVLVKDGTLSGLALRLVGMFPAGFSLEIRYDPIL